MGIIVIIFLAAAVVSMIMAAIAIFNPFNLYNRIFNKDKCELWKYFIDNSDKFVFENEDDWGKHFYWRGDDKTYEAIIRPEALFPKAGRCGIFDETDCVLCSFDKHNSDTMMKKLLEKI